MSELDFPKTLLEIGDREGAIKALTALLRKDIHNFDAWFLLVEAFNDYSKKADCFRQILRIDPENQQAQDKLRELVATKHVKQSETQQSIPLPGLEQNIERKPQIQAFESTKELNRTFRNLFSKIKTAGQKNEGLFFILALIFGSLIIILGCLGISAIRNKLSSSFAPPATHVSKIVLPPTWTLKPKSIYTPILSPTPKLFSQTLPEIYVPSLSEIPTGFQIATLPQLTLENAVVSDRSFVKPNAVIGEVQVLGYTVFIFQDEENAINGYDALNGFGTHMVRFIPVSNETLSMIDHKMSFYEIEVKPDTMVASITCNHIFNIRNVIAQTLCIGYIEQNDELAMKNILNSCGYFESLLAHKLMLNN